jgi:predicted NBD/HSP70 family sugar kinase
VVQAADVLALMQNRHPELRRAGPIARAAKIKKALAPLQLPLAVDHDALSALWADVADDAARRQARVGL